MPAKKTSPAAAVKKTATAVVDPFATMVVEDAPAPTRARPAAPEVTPSVKAFAAKLIKDGPQYVAITGWGEDKMKLFVNTLRRNRDVLFPDCRVRITPTADGTAFHVSLGKLGTRAGK